MQQYPIVKISVNSYLRQVEENLDFFSVTVLSTLSSAVHFCPVNNISVFDSKTFGQVQAILYWKLWDLLYLPTARVKNKEPRHICLSNSCAFAFPQFTLNSTPLIIACFNICKTYQMHVLCM